MTKEKAEFVIVAKATNKIKAPDFQLEGRLIKDGKIETIEIGTLKQKDVSIKLNFQSIAEDAKDEVIQLDYKTIFAKATKAKDTDKMMKDVSTHLDVKDDVTIQQIQENLKKPIQLITPPNPITEIDSIKELVDKIIAHVKPYRKEGINLGSLRTTLETNLKKICTEEQIEFLNDNPDKLETYANKIIIALADIKVQTKQDTGSWILRNKKINNLSTLIESIGNLVASIIEYFKTGKTDAIQDYNKNKAHIITWDTSKINNFLENIVNKEIPTKNQKVNALETLKNIIPKKQIIKE